MANVTIVDPSGASDLYSGTVAISPSGAYRAAVAYDNTAAVYKVYRSTTGASWTNLGVPAATPQAVGVADDGTVYAINSAFPQKFYVYTGSWSAGVGPFASGTPYLVGRIGTTLVSVWIISGGKPEVFYSTDGGATWTSGGLAAGPSTLVAQHSFVLIGNYVHGVYTSGSSWIYDRWNLSTHTWDTSTQPGWVTFDGTWQEPVVFSRHGSTTEIWIAQVSNAGGTANFWVSTDTGSTWTSHTGESIPTALGVGAIQGLSMGSDDKIHVWSRGDGTTIKTVGRTRGGTWDTAAASALISGYQMKAKFAQRQDGTHSNDYELFGLLELTNGTTTPTRLVWISDVVLPGGWSVGTVRIG